MKKNKLIILIVLIFCIIGFIFLSGWFFISEKPKIYEPIFSPNGEFLVLSIKWKGKESIYRVRKDGSGLVPLTSPKGYDFYPSYSSDGSKIVFCSALSDKPGTAADIYIMNADGSDRRPLTYGPSHNIFPIFSKDGCRVYFVRAKTFKSYSPVTSSAWHDMDIYSINIDGSDLKHFTQGKFYQMSPISFSPDGRQLLVGIPEKDDSLWLIPMDKPNEKKAIRPDVKKYLPEIKEKPWATEPIQYNNFNDPCFMHLSKSLIFIWGGALSR